MKSTSFRSLIRNLLRPNKLKQRLTIYGYNSDIIHQKKLFTTKTHILNSSLDQTSHRVGNKRFFFVLFAMMSEATKLNRET